MNQMKVFVGVLALLVVLAAAWGSAYVVSEGRQAIITQFGRPIGDPVTHSGLHFKVPFIQKVRFIDKRILTWDGEPEQIPTKDKKFIVVDTTARWKITDALKFIQTVENERGAKNRLDTILDGVTRDTISNYNLVEAVRNSNGILDKIKDLKAKRKKRTKEQEGKTTEVLPEEEEVFGEIEAINEGREKLSQQIVAAADKELERLGIKLIDVQLRRIAYESSVEKKVFDRMISERKRIAEKIRSIGKGEQAKIQGKVSRDLQKIQAQAYRKAQEIKGKAEARAINIYAKALNRNPRFYEFLRTMEAYQKSLKPGTELILSTDSEFLRAMRKP